MRYPDDVPVQRPSVGAMGLAMGNQTPAKITKPYVYRGTGNDIYETAADRVVADWLEEESTWRPKPKPRKKRKRKPNPARTARVARADRWAARGGLPATDPSPEPSSPDATAAAGATEPEEPWRDPVLNVPIRRPLRSAPGWKPTIGADLADLLEELEQA